MNLRVILILLCALAACLPTTAQVAPKERVCMAYCPYYRTTQLPDPSIVTHINYGFAEVYVTADGVYNGFKLQGDEAMFRRVVALKEQNPAIRICLSFSHTVTNSDNRQGGGFSAIAASADNRSRFAADCLAFVEKWGIDGIDLDWEFPGLSWSGSASNPAIDTPNYTLLLRRLRETLGQNRLLTFAGYVMDFRRNTDGTMRYIDITAALPYVDFINVMTYDMDEAPNYQNAVRSETSYYDCESAVETYIKAGVPPEKIVLGIPFYLRHSFDGATTAVDYKQLLVLGKNSNWEINLYDEQAHAAYATYKGQFYGSYDNERSIAFKGEWIHSLGLRGMLYWDCGADDSEYTLSKAVWNAVMKSYE